MKKLIFFISLCLFVSCAVSAQTLQSRVNKVIETVNKNEAEIKEVESKIDKLSDRFDNLEYAVDKQKDIIAQEQSAIENSLGSASQTLSIFSYILGAIGVLITILGFGLGVYISKKQKKVESLLQIVEEKKNAVELLNTTIEETSRTMQQLNDDINKDVEGLYQRLRREETVTLLKRLVDVPEDISNIDSLLLSRTLDPEDFELLLKAYTKLMSENSEYAENLSFSSYKRRYLLLFFQHFCGKSIQSSLLRNDIISYLSLAIQCAFKTDIKNSISSLIETLNNTTIEEGNEYILTKFIAAFNSSKHKNYIEPYQLIVDKCNDSINLQSVWGMLAEQSIIIEPFGNLLTAKYKADTEFIKAVKEQIEASKEVEEEKKETA